MISSFAFAAGRTYETIWYEESLLRMPQRHLDKISRQHTVQAFLKSKHCLFQVKAGADLLGNSESQRKL